jgi:CxxC motif-containing protein (DUF1111 family)
MVLRWQHVDGKILAAYGRQLQDRAIAGVPAEGALAIRWEPVAVRFGDGTVATLRRPIFDVTDLAFGELPTSVRFMPRVAPAVFGLGLLEHVDEAMLREWDDPADVDRDGISGRAVNVNGELGKFGWKAQTPSLREQAVSAASEDIGLTSDDKPGENCPEIQVQCRSAEHGGKPEIPNRDIERLTRYLMFLGVPPRRQPTAPAVIRGAEFFDDFGCARCHRPQLRTNKLAQPSWLADQTFSAYTDLLVHDMGPALSDPRMSHLESAREWRTAPLWGIGLIETVNGHQQLLHDGRANGVAEAILWHGGEATASRERFRLAPKQDRDDLVAFVNDL